ncbi:MAG: COG1361 S-layer family protein [Natronincolaceae bacterium]|jgi:hypothetical protein|nr:CARDB domain-containing protein [Bacillota bacterium]
MKKITIFLILLTFLVSPHTGFLLSYGENSTDIVISNHDGLSKIIYEGDSFTLNFELSNRTNEELSDVYVEIEDTGSFYPLEVGSKIFLTGSIGVGKKTETSLKFKYTGGTSTRLPIKIIYTKSGSELSIIDYIGINAVPDSAKPKPEPEDTSKYIPVLNITNSSASTLEAGTTETVSFTVRNNSDYTAENITIYPNVTDGDSPFTIENLTQSRSLSRIRPNGRSSFDLKITTDATAKERSYPIKLKYQFYNDYGNPFTSEETIYIKVVNKNTYPKLHVESISLPTEEIKPGTKVDVGFLIKNIGTLEAKNINLSIQGLKGDGFSVVNMTNQQYKASLTGNKSLYVSYFLKASDKIEGGTHNLDLKLQYKDDNNNNYEDTYQFFINTKTKDEKPSNLFIENIITPNYDVQAGKEFKIKFDLKNNGVGEAKNIKISLEMDKEIIPKSPSIIKLQKINANETKPLEFTLSSTSEATTKNYPISINIEYEDDAKENEKQILNQYVGVYVEKEGEGSSSIPKIIIDQYSFNPHIVKAGENFDLNVSFLNTNRSKAVQNIKVFLTVDEETQKSGSVFTPVNSSNTFYIDYITPKSRVEKDIVMYTVPDAGPKTYTIRVNLEYEDLDGNQYNPVEFIGIPVVQQTKLETTDINLPPEAFVGEMIPISFELYNMGKVTLNNLMIRMEGNFQTEDANYFVGNFDAGNTEYYETMITPTEPGLLEGNIILSYEDSNGETVEITKNFSLNVMEAPTEEFPPEGPNPEMNRKGGIKKILSWVILIAVMAATVFIIVRKKIIKRRGIDLDE